MNHDIKHLVKLAGLAGLATRMGVGAAIGAGVGSLSSSGTHDEQDKHREGDRMLMGALIGAGAGAAHHAGANYAKATKPPAKSLTERVTGITESIDTKAKDVAGAWSQGKKFLKSPLGGMSAEPAAQAASSALTPPVNEHLKHY